MDMKKVLSYGVGLVAIGVGAYFLFKNHEPTPPPEPPPDKANIYGQITNSVTGEVISGATVHIGTTDLTTDIDGNFYLLDQTPMMYTISVSKENYVTYTSTVNVIEGNNGFSITLVPVEIPPEEFAYITGRVTNPAGTGIQTVSISIGNTTLTTDNSGNFGLSGNLKVVPGTYLVVAEKTSYQTLQQNHTFVVGDNVLNITLAFVPQNYPRLPLGSFSVMIDVGNVGLIQGEVNRLISVWGGVSPSTNEEILAFVGYRAAKDHFSYDPQNAQQIHDIVLKYLGQYVTNIVYNGYNM